jgi:hypothetical protein
MEQRAAASEPTHNQEAGGTATDAGSRDPAVEAMIAGIERLDELGLGGVEPAAAFLWS